jgi:hypothetical protein
MSCKCCSSGTSCSLTVHAKPWTPWPAGLTKKRLWQRDHCGHQSRSFRQQIGLESLGHHKCHSASSLWVYWGTEFNY